jgi:hypothetical protein
MGKAEGVPRTLSSFSDILAPNLKSRSFRMTRCPGFVAVGLSGGPVDLEIDGTRPRVGPIEAIDGMPVVDLKLVLPCRP